MTVTTRRHGRILLVQMDRPAKRNAIDSAMTAGLDAALNELDDDPELWAGGNHSGPGCVILRCVGA